MNARENVSARVADLVATCQPQAAVMNRIALRAIINEEITKAVKEYPEFKESLDKIELSDRMGWAAFLEKYDPDKAPLKHGQPTNTLRV